MKPTWVIESNVFAEACFDEMLKHFRINDIPHHVVRIIPFVHEIDGPVPEVVGPCIVYGSIGIHKLAQRHGWSPGVFTGSSFSEDVAIECIGDLMVNADAQHMMLSEVEHHIREWSDDRQFFIKPNTDTKEFAGAVMERKDFLPWVGNMRDIGYLSKNDFGVVVAAPKKLACEWRVVVVNGQIADCSIYRQYGIVKPERHILPEITDLVKQAHQRFAPADVYVIDIAQVAQSGPGYEFKIVEYNTFNSAGLYACDVGLVIDRINEFLDG